MQISQLYSLLRELLDVIFEQKISSSISRMFTSIHIKLLKRVCFRDYLFLKINANLRKIGICFVFITVTIFSSFCVLGVIFNFCTYKYITPCLHNFQLPELKRVPYLLKYIFYFLKLYVYNFKILLVPFNYLFW